MRIERTLFLSTKDQKVIEDFSILIKGMCKEIGDKICTRNCMFKPFCGKSDIITEINDYDYLYFLEHFFNIEIDYNFEEEKVKERKEDEK